MFITRTPKRSFYVEAFDSYCITDRQIDICDHTAFAVVITCEQSFLETGGLRLQAINVYGGIRRRLPENWSALFAATVIQCGDSDCSAVGNRCVHAVLSPRSAAVIHNQPHNVLQSQMMGTNYLSISYNYSF